MSAIQTGNQCPVFSSFDAEWRTALRNGRLARCRRRVCELRRSAQVHSSASKPSTRDTILGVLETIELKARQGWLHLQKVLLKIERLF